MNDIAPPRYRLVLPPGFLLIPVARSTDDEVADLVRRHYRDLPRDSYGPQIDRAAAQLVASARSARDAGALDLVVPMGVAWRAPVSLTIAISTAPAPSRSTAPAADSDEEDPSPSAARETVTTSAGEAVRETVRFTPPASADEMAPLLRLRFVWPIPGGDGELRAICTISGKADAELAPIVDGLTELGDLLLRTLRWD
ncbi:hypothetical protein [Microbacterium dextranolyticum]|uniref:Uncharacterized protein n=1 Tax=Microbacterium dextranolyticum TaxID=36806 RepID=A0A9W6HIY8_9MICO|nr:hypothetical protein [Microbacterium dextranolyticum]MBM7461831.1 hypothetical protein [Microbacterium dextranolyticum]GLJ94072.1 hypothetical protein GCM10017591_01330 [Microbacterium dextranolyticum]